MLTKVKTATLSGVNGYPVTVETDLHRGLPGFHVVGLADTTIKESCSRIKPAIMNCGYRFPQEKVTVNLVPAGKPKEGSHFDLPMALGIMMLGEDIIGLEHTAFIGEVSLDGKINGVRGVLPLAICLRESGIKNIVVPAENAEEAAILEDISILPVTHLSEAAEYVRGERNIDVYIRKETKQEIREDSADFAQVIGQESIKRAMVIGAAGNHGMLMVGGPGCGKTMMARCIPGILPELTFEEKIEITGIYSAAGMLSEKNPIISHRPFRSPHHTITQAALIGGGAKPRPGELSLAHRGVLFLDELGEFDPRIIDAMRQPIEEGVVRINRNLEEVILPAKVMIVAAANPCKCGYLWDDKKICTCTRRQLDSYRRKLMGPFADRIDMHIKVSQVSRDSIAAKGTDSVETGSAVMKKKVQEARLMQAERYAQSAYQCNSELDEKGIRKFCRTDSEGEFLMSEAYDKLGLSMRACSRLLKVARTIADIDASDRIQAEHIAEALMYRIDMEWR